ncbi:MAG: hypothetical protein ACK5MT_04955 [Actinomycetales bacterium]
MREALMTNDQPQAAPETDGEEKLTDDRVMHLLSEHVPISLIVDLSRPHGPDSEEILTEEGQPEDAWWGVDGDGSVDAEEDETP